MALNIGKKRSNIIIKQELEKIERSISKFFLAKIIECLTKYMNESQKVDSQLSTTRRQISFGCPLIFMIALAKCDQYVQYHSSKKITEKDLERWSKKILKLVNNLIKPEYAKKNLMKDLIGFPDKINKWELINADIWKKVCQYILRVPHSRFKNIETQSNFTRASFIPIIRSFHLTNLFVDSIKDECLKQEFSGHFEKVFGTTDVKEIHKNLFRIALLLFENKGELYEADFKNLLESSKNLNENNLNQQPDIADEQKDRDYRVLTKLLDLLSTNCEEVICAYATLTRELFEQKTMGININPVYDQPIYKSYTSSGVKYVCPGEPLLRLRLDTLIVRTIDEWVGENKGLSNSTGSSKEEYLLNRLYYHKALFVSGGIINLDNQTDAERYLLLKTEEHYANISKADFILETDKYLVIVECKNSLGMWKPFYENKDSYFNSVDRIHKALMQCNDTHKRLKSEYKQENSKPVFHLLVVNENVCAEVAFVGLIYCMAQRYSSDKETVKDLLLRPGNYSVISLAAFDFLLYTDTLDKFIDECREKGGIIRSKTPDNHLFGLIRAALNNLFNYHDAFKDEANFQYFKDELNNKLLTP